MKNIMFIAPPAAGKGTQAELVNKKYSLPHISTGDILREISKEDSEIGSYVYETLASGKLVKDEITYQLIEDRLSKEDCKNGFIIDGFPRNLDQAIEYDKILAKLGYNIGNVILIDINEKTLEKRITGRRICEDCKSIYNINDEKSSPQVEFKTRYAMYLEKTAPIIEHYKKQNVLHVVNGEDTVENIFNEIDKIISND